jgi:prolyl-tRNA editing enzyme YbaK/EbsC (Cys-tRNA(Pro) deacylase)
MAEPIVSVGGGIRGMNLHLTPQDLVGALGAEVVDLGQA